MKCYLRFGNLPTDNISKQYKSGEIIKEEKGLSVWNCAFVNDVPFPILPENATESCMADYFYMLMSNRPVFLVTGTELKEKGSAGEPLLTTPLTVIKEYTKDYNSLKSVYGQIKPKLEGDWEWVYNDQWLLNCPFCNHKVVEKYLQYKNYCPNCGAKLEVIDRKAYNDDK